MASRIEKFVGELNTWSKFGDSLNIWHHTRTSWLVNFAIRDLLLSPPALSPLTPHQFTWLSLSWRFTKKIRRTTVYIKASTCPYPIVRVYCKGFEWISLESRRDGETISPRQVQILQCSSSSDTQTLMTDGSSSWNLSAIFVKCFFFYS